MLYVLLVGQLTSVKTQMLHVWRNHCHLGHINVVVKVISLQIMLEFVLKVSTNLFKSDYIANIQFKQSIPHGLIISPFYHKIILYNKYQVIFQKYLKIGILSKTKSLWNVKMWYKSWLIWIKFIIVYHYVICI